MEAEIKLSGDGKEESQSTELNLDISADKMEDCCGIVEAFDNLLEHYGGHSRLRTIANGGIHDSVSQKCIVDTSKLLASFYDELKSASGYENQYNKLSETSHKYKDNRDFLRYFDNWSKSRKEMIKIIKSAAEKLDRNSLFCNIAGTIGGIAEILFSLNFYLPFSISSFAYDVSPKLGLVMDSALELGRNLRYIGLLSSFIGIMESERVIICVKNAVSNDKCMFIPLKEWFDETKELDGFVKRLFPYGINKEITLNIERALEDLGKEEKIFSATVLSNFIEDPMILKNGNFMLEAFLFSKSDTAKEWYKRLILDTSVLDLEYETFYLLDEMVKRIEIFPDSALKIELGKCIVLELEHILTKNVRSILGRLLICCMSGMSIYNCIESMNTGSRHMYSTALRKLSTNAQLFLNKMEKTMHLMIV